MFGSLSLLALVIYVGCLGANWAWQVGFLCKLAGSGVSNGHALCIALYLGLISQVVYDDVVLVRWLWRNVHKTAGALSDATRSPKKQR